MIDRAKNALSRLEDYCAGTQYQGWDVFDGLNSRLLSYCRLDRSRLVRLAWIQFFKKSPINFRSIALVPKGRSAKALALFASGALSREQTAKAKQFLQTLREMRSVEYGGFGWGYQFPWQARAFYVPAGKPNMVVTAFVAGAFLEHFERTGNRESLETAVNGCEFILKNLVLFEDEDTLCFGYIPGEKTRVHNANLLGAALLGRVYKHVKEPDLYIKSLKSIEYSIAALKDGLWPYGEASHHGFIDNFHTAYNLFAIKQWSDATEDPRYYGRLKEAFGIFLTTFWLENGCPKYYHDRLYPIDIHGSAQGIVTCLEFQDLFPCTRQIDRITRWVIDNMQDRRGYFHYQKMPFFTSRIPYIRWAQAWMYYALSKYVSERASTSL